MPDEGVLQRGRGGNPLRAAALERHAAVAVRHDAPRPQQRPRQLPPRVTVRVQDRRLLRRQLLPAPLGMSGARRGREQEAPGTWVLGDGAL